MARVLPVLIEVVLLVVCLIDLAQTPDHASRNLPRWLWAVLIILLPIVGPLAWLFAGRPTPASRRAAAGQSPIGYPQRPRTSAPDDDPEFLATLKKGNAEHERLLKQWEDDLKRREEELRKQQDGGTEG